ncbi:MAG TPA: sulfotransferase domain-containing protein [Rhizomicrobium sp.]|jgi:hypothetical protein
MSKTLVLIASYPKSGNTWTRIVFERLRRGPEFPIGALVGRFQGTQLRHAFDAIAPVEAADLLPAEIELFLPEVFRRIASDLPERTFVKTHDAARRNAEGEWLHPPECVHAVIYLARHPFDVAVSTAHHFGIGIDKAVAFMGDQAAIPQATSRLPETLFQCYDSWSAHVASWADEAPYGVAFARYEDLLADPVAQFLRLARAAGFNAAAADVARVVAVSGFEQLQRDEQLRGFSERPKSSPQFFRSGRSGSWQGVLSESLRETLLRDHGPMMERLGYAADGSALPASALVLPGQAGS